jgi:hypothetical protein
MDHSFDTSDSESGENAFFDADDAIIDGRGNRRSIRYSATPLSSDVERILAEAEKANRNKRHSQLLMVDGSGLDAPHTINESATREATSPATAKTDSESQSDVDHTERVEQNDIVPKELPAVKPTSATYPRAKRASLVFGFGASAASIGRSTRRDVSQRVSSRRLSRAAECMALGASQSSGSSCGVTLGALDLADETNILGRRLDIDEDDSQDGFDEDDRKSVKSTRSAIRPRRSNFRPPYRVQGSVASAMPAIASTANSAMPTLGASHAQTGQLTPTSPCLELPEGRRSMDVQSINLAMWQGKLANHCSGCCD